MTLKGKGWAKTCGCDGKLKAQMSGTDVMHMSTFHELFVTLLPATSTTSVPRLFHGSWASLTKSLPSSAKRVPSSNSVMPCAPAPLAACNSRASFAMLLLLFSEELCFFGYFLDYFALSLFEQIFQTIPYH